MLNEASGAGEAGGGGVRHLIDAYCGSGLFSLCAAVGGASGASGASGAASGASGAAGRWESIVGIETSGSAVEAAQRNAAANRVSRLARFERGEASRIFETLAFDGADAAVIVDPPRRGCDAAFLSQLLRFAPRRIVYVSCETSTQARDLRTLVAAG